MWKKLLLKKFFPIVCLLLLCKESAFAGQWVPGTVEGEIHYGYATYYGGGYEGGCSMLDPVSKEYYVTALNIFDFDNSKMSGAYLEVTGSRGTIKVLVTDLLPEGQKGDLDLNTDAFPMVADPIDGKVPISWRIIPMEVNGPVQYKFKEGSSQWWIGVQVRNHRYPVAKFEYLNDKGVYVEVPRRNYNYFETREMGPGPYTFRVTDIYGHVIEDKNIAFTGPETITYGNSQFPFRPQDVETQPKTYTITGNIKPDIDISSPSVNEGFLVEFGGKQAVTDRSGNFTIKDVPEGTKGKMVISKPNYLKRSLEISSIKENVSFQSPLAMWAGDMEVEGLQDGAINIGDVMEVAKGFNASEGEPRYTPRYDLNLDKAVNLTDIMIVARHFNSTPSSYPQS